MLLNDLELDPRDPAWPQQFQLNFRTENFTSNGLGYIPGFLRYLDKFRSYQFSDDKVVYKTSVMYQFVPLSCLSKVVAY